MTELEKILNNDLLSKVELLYNQIRKITNCCIHKLEDDYDLCVNTYILDDGFYDSLQELINDDCFHINFYSSTDESPFYISISKDIFIAESFDESKFELMEDVDNAEYKLILKNESELYFQEV